MIRGCNDHEVIAADMSDKIRGGAKCDNRFAYNSGSGFDDLIAFGITVAIVKWFEIINIQQAKGDRFI